MQSHRFPQLDALRGVAAFFVFCHHSLMMLPVLPPWLQWIMVSPLGFFCDGLAAVMLFFVLSGFVLNLKYVSLPKFPERWAGAFIINRVFRIYPAFYVAILVSLALRFFVYDQSLMNPMASALAEYWRHPLNIDELLRLMTLVGPGIHPDQIDPPMWTMVTEMRISLCFPLIVWWFARRCGFLLDLLLVVAVYVACFWTPSVTIFYLPCFVLGAFGAKHFDRLRSPLSKFGAWQQAIWWIAAVLLYTAGATLAKYKMTNWYTLYIAQQAVGLGAFGIIFACISFPKISALLCAKPFQFMGATSYSFYLLHVLFLMAPGPLVYHLTGSWLITWTSILCLTYAVAWLVFTFVEKPMIKKGHAAAHWFSTAPDSVK